MVIASRERVRKKPIPVSANDEDTRRILARLGIKEAHLYDYTDEGDDIYADTLNPDLSEAEIEDALKVRRFRRGVMLVTGPPGGGKGLLGHTMAWKLKRYFKGVKALLDHKPKPAFGPYLPFDEGFLHEELAKMAKISEVNIKTIPTEIDRDDKKRLKDISALANKWVTSEAAEVFLRNSVLLLEEFKRYLHNRRPMNPMGITIGHIITWWRHLDILILGMTPQKREIDAISCLPLVTHEVRCSWQPSGLAKCSVYQTHWVSSRGVLNVQGRPVTIYIDGWKQRDELGGARYIDIYNSKFMPSSKPMGG